MTQQIIIRLPQVKKRLPFVSHSNSTRSKHTLAPLTRYTHSVRNLSIEERLKKAGFPGLKKGFLYRNHK